MYTYAVLNLTVKQVIHESEKWQHKKAWAPRYSDRGSQKFKHFARKFIKGPLVKERALLRLRIWIWEYKQKANFEIHLPPKSCHNFTLWCKDGHTWSIVITYLKSVSKLYANNSSPDIETTWNYATGTLTSWKGC